MFGYDEVGNFVPCVIRKLKNQNKQPLTPAQVFQDVPADHAFKTMTMEAFPHSGQQLASVHPCRHASVMKKFINRMEAAQSQGVEDPKSSTVAGNKKKWGIGGMVRRVTGGEKPKEKEASGGSEEEPTGVQVDFYLVIVCQLMKHRTQADDQFLKFIASIVPTIEVILIPTGQSCELTISGGQHHLDRSMKRDIVPWTTDQDI